MDSVQAIIGNYAVPILEETQVWSTDDDTRTSYLDSQDIARMTMAALRNEETFGTGNAAGDHSDPSPAAVLGKTLTLAGPKAYTTNEIINMCEKRANATAKVTKVGCTPLKTGDRHDRSTRRYLWAS